MSNPDEHTFEQALGDLLELPEVQREAALEHIGEKDAALRARLASVIALSKSRAGELLTPPDAGIAPPIGDLEQDPLIGASFDGFTLVSLVGAGGSGRVYEARQTSPDRRVALKVLQGSLVSTAQVRRFREEAQVLAGLQHPGICGLIASDSTVFRGQSLPYLVMEFVEGVPLTQAALTLSLDDKLRLMLAVCDAVEYAHRKGIIHRDLKPANVLVEQQAGTPPRTRVVDFGLAKLVAEGQHTLTRDAHALIGTIQYMSPERLVNDTAQPAVPDTRWDVYAIGVMLFEVLAGRRPFDGAGDSASVAAMLRASENPSLSSALPGVHNDLALIADKAMARDINQRYASVAALADDLRAHLEHRPITAHPPSMVYRARKFLRRERGLSLGVGLALVAIIAGTIATAIALQRAMTSRNHARAALDASRVNEYIANIQSAAAYLRSNDARQAHQSLESAPQEFRGLEWHLLNAECEQSVRRFAVPAGDPDYAYPKLAYSPDGKYVVCTKGNSLSLIDSITGSTRTSRLSIGADNELSDILWPRSQANLYVCIRGVSPSLLVIDPDSLSILKHVPIDSRAGVFTPCLDPSEDSIVIGGTRFSGPRPRGYIQVRDAQTLDVVYQDNARPFGLRAIPTKLPHTLVTLTTDDRVEVVNWSSGETTQLPIPTDGGGQGRNALALSPDGSLFAVASMLGTQVWSVDPLRRVMGLDATHGVSHHRLAFGPTGETLYAFQHASLTGWNIRSGAIIAHSAVVASEGCETMVMAPHGREIAAVHDNVIRIMSTTAMGGATMIRAREGSALSPDFSTLARLSLPPDTAGMVTVDLADPITGETLRAVDAVPPACVARRTMWSPDGVLLMTEFLTKSNTEGGLSVLDTRTGERREVFGVDPERRADPAISPDSKYIAYATALNRWIIADAQTLSTLSEHAETESSRLYSFSFSPDASTILLAFTTNRNDSTNTTTDTSVPGTISLRQFKGGTTLHEYHAEDLNTWIQAYFSPDGRWIVAFHSSNTLLLDASTLQVISTLSLRSETQGLAWCPDSTRLLAGCVDGTMRIIAIFHQRTPDAKALAPHLVETLSLRGDSWMKRPFASVDGTRVGCVTVFPANRCFIWDARPTYQPARARPSLHY